MARKFLTPIDLSQLELQNAKIQNLTTSSINAISSPVSGQFVFDTTLHVLKVYDGTTWSFVGGAATGSGAPASTPTSTGSIYFDTTNYVLYVAKGTSSSADWVYSDPRGATGDMANLSTANSAGTSIKVAPIDHVHRHTNADHGSITINSLATPTANVAWGSYKITGLADPTNAQDAATKAYVDNAVVGIDWKPSVRLASTANVASISGLLTIDSVTVVAGNRVLLKDQSTASQNGIYVVASGAWTRATDLGTSATNISGFAVFVEEGTVNADTGWVCSTNEPITVGTDPITFIQFTGLGEVTAGAGLTKTGNTMDVGTASTARIVVNADNIDLATVSQSNTTPASTTNFVSAITVDSYGRVSGVATTSHSDASTSAKGIASFASGTFSVTSGAVDVKSGGISNTQLANSSITVTAGTNITVSGSPVALGGSVTVGLTGQVAVANGGTGASTAAGARTNLSAAGKYTTTNPGLTQSGGAVTWTVNHALNAQTVVVQVYDSSALTDVQVDVTRTDVNNVTLSWASSTNVTSGAYTVVVLG
jgi:hypothetical protein